MRPFLPRAVAGEVTVLPIEEGHDGRRALVLEHCREGEAGGRRMSNWSGRRRFRRRTWSSSAASAIWKETNGGSRNGNLVNIQRAIINYNQLDAPRIWGGPELLFRRLETIESAYPDRIWDKRDGGSGGGRWLRLDGQAAFGDRRRLTARGAPMLKTKVGLRASRKSEPRSAIDGCVFDLGHHKTLDLGRRVLRASVAPVPSMSSRTAFRQETVPIERVARVVA